MKGGVALVALWALALPSPAGAEGPPLTFSLKASAAEYTTSEKIDLELSIARSLGHRDGQSNPITIRLVR